MSSIHHSWNSIELQTRNIPNALYLSSYFQDLYISYEYVGHKHLLPNLGSTLTNRILIDHDRPIVIIKHDADYLYMKIE